MNLKALARYLANSSLLAHGRQQWLRNQRDWDLRLSKWDKLLVGVYLILNDYSTDQFPPTFLDQQQAFEAEIAYKFALPGTDVDRITDRLMRKPFWSSRSMRQHLSSLTDLVEVLERLELHPPRKLLELGCGTGWMAELLALLQFDVVGTSISPYEIEDAKSRIQSLAAKRINFSLRFHATPMETVDEAVGDYLPFDGVFVFEALHHAYNWRQALAASYRCLRPGGWLVIAQEPNVSHTYVAYRVAKLSNTHEIGFSRKELVQQLNAIGFINVSVVKDRVAFRVKPHWLVAQKDL